MIHKIFKNQKVQLSKRILIKQIENLLILMILLIFQCKIKKSLQVKLNK